MNRLLGALMTLAMLVGMRAYNKHEVTSDLKARLTSLCSGDASCLASIATNFDGCFENAYGVARSKDDGQRVAQSLVSCLSQKSGEEYFVASRK